MTSNRPYLIRAMYDWISDNQLTPYMLVNASKEGVYVPSQFVQDNNIVLNVAARAVQHLELENDVIRFQARFSGVSTEVSFPPSAVLAIYARENGLGMAFDEEGDDDGGGDDDGQDDTPPTSPAPSPSTKPRPHLKLVK